MGIEMFYTFFGRLLISRSVLGLMKPSPTLLINIKNRLAARDRTMIIVVFSFGVTFLIFFPVPVDAPIDAPVACRLPRLLNHGLWPLKPSFKLWRLAWVH